MENSIHEFEREGSLFKGNLYSVVREIWVKFLTLKYAQFMIIVALLDFGCDVFFWFFFNFEIPH